MTNGAFDYDVIVVGSGFGGSVAAMRAQEKGYRTLVATPSGDVFVNPTGTPGMATAGSGDVLTGMLASALAQLLDPERAAQLAVYLHGLAGELADADEGDVAMLAGDIVRHIGDAVQDLTAREHATPRQE